MKNFNKKILKGLLKGTLWILHPKRLVIIFVLVATLWGGITIYNWKVERGIIKAGILACEELHDKNTNEFTQITGLTADNVFYGTPTITKARNLRIFDFEEIKVGNKNTAFICHYNIATGKAKDETPLKNEIKE